MTKKREAIDVTTQHDSGKVVRQYQPPTTDAELELFRRRINAEFSIIKQGAKLANDDGDNLPMPLDCRGWSLASWFSKCCDAAGLYSLPYATLAMYSEDHLRSIINVVWFRTFGWSVLANDVAFDLPDWLDFSDPEFFPRWIDKAKFDIGDDVCLWLHVTDVRTGEYLGATPIMSTGLICDGSYGVDAAHGIEVATQIECAAIANMPKRFGDLDKYHEHTCHKFKYSIMSKNDVDGDFVTYSKRVDAAELNSEYDAADYAQEHIDDNNLVDVFIVRELIATPTLRYQWRLDDGFTRN